MHRFNFRNYQPMNLIVRTSEGDYGAATDIKLLKQKKIQYVLTAAAMLNINYPKEAQINHKVINAYDMPSYKMTPHFQQVYQFISDALKSGNILVHCAAGISRSTTCVIVYLMRAKGYSFKQSLQFCRSKRPIVNPNYGFQNQLSKYQINLKKNVGNQKEKVLINKLSQKQPKIQLEKQSLSTKQSLITKQVVQQQKNAVMKFIGQQKPKPRFNSTVKDQKISQPKGSQLRSNNLNANRTMIGIRGNSTNFHYRTDNNRESENKLVKQFINYKFQQPKIVTIKR